MVLVGGRVLATPELRERVRGADLVVAADGGLQHASALGLRPDLLVGDMDSVSQAMLAAHVGIETEGHPTDKDALDLELALEACRRRGHDRVLVVGGLSGRLDQTLATCLIAQAVHAAGLATEVSDGVRDLWPLREGERRRLPLAAGRTFSLLPLDAKATVSVQDAHYPLDRVSLARGSGRGVSNVALHEGPEVQLHQGALVVVAPGEKRVHDDNVNG